MQNDSKYCKKKHTSVYKYIQKQKISTIEQAVTFCKKEFVFCGKEIVNEWFMSCLLLPGAHDDDCYKTSKKRKNREIKKTNIKKIY
jgi:3-methyladenine DNA glycosylase Tag